MKEKDDIERGLLASDELYLLVATKDGDLRFYFEGEPIGPLSKKSSRS